MKQIILFLAILGLGIIFSNPAEALNPPPPEFGMHFGFFHSSLSPHGEWIEIESGFHVWRPLHMHSWWRPYLIGRWAWTDYGWYWMSDEPFGWVTYHYGRWYYDDYYGWVWMPDDTWGPAWVEWRYDNDYIGWAPLAPYATFSVSLGIHYTNHWVAPPRYWNFIKYRHFGGVHRYNDFIPESRVRRMIGRTRSDYRYGMDNDRVINHGIDRTIIERRGRINIQRIAVQEERSRSGERLVRSNDSRTIERIEIHRPTSEEMQNNPAPSNIKRGTRSLSIDIKKIERRRTETGMPSPERPGRDQGRTEQKPSEPIEKREPQHEKKEGPGVRVQEPRQEPRPVIREQRPSNNQQEKRKELIQRHENKQSPAPPVRQERQNRVEGQRQSGSNSSTNRHSAERQRGSEDRGSRR